MCFGRDVQLSATLQARSDITCDVAGARLICSGVPCSTCGSDSSLTSNSYEPSAGPCTVCLVCGLPSRTDCRMEERVVDRLDGVVCGEMARAPPNRQMCIQD
jgi:hypothetical protein